METIPTHIRKAAILLRSLDSETSAQLLAQLSSEEVALVRTAVRSLRDVVDEERADVLTEFCLAGSEASHNDPGVEIADSLLSLSKAAKSSAAVGDFSDSTESQAFSFLSDIASGELAPYLGRQHAQTVAVILSYLDATRAASLLGELPGGLQTDVVQRLSDLGTTDQESLKIIQDELATWLGQHQQFDSTAPRGDHAARILAAAKPDVRDDLLLQLGHRNGQLAELLKQSLQEKTNQVHEDDAPARYRPTMSRPNQPKMLPTHGSNRTETPELRPSSDSKPIEADIHDSLEMSQLPISPLRIQPHSTPARPTIPFHRLAELDIAVLETVFRTADPAVTRLALAGADDALVTRVEGLLPKASVRKFRRQLHQLGPTRLSDVTLAQRTLAESASAILEKRASAHSARSRRVSSSQTDTAYA